MWPGRPAKQKENLCWTFAIYNSELRQLIDAATSSGMAVWRQTTPKITIFQSEEFADLNILSWTCCCLKINANKNWPTKNVEISNSQNFGKKSSARPWDERNSVYYVTLASKNGRMAVAVTWSVNGEFRVRWLISDTSILRLSKATVTRPRAFQYATIQADNLCAHQLRISPNRSRLCVQACVGPTENDKPVQERAIQFAVTALPCKRHKNVK